MKNKIIWSIGLCGAICLSITRVTYASYASALASDTPKVSTYETVHHLENSELRLPIYFESPVPSVLVPLHNKDG